MILMAQTLLQIKATITMVAVAMAIAKTTATAIAKSTTAITVKVIPEYILDASSDSECLIHRQEQLLTLCFNYTLHSDHLTFIVCLCCLY